ncbi:HAD-IC family P-type ATPase [Rhodocyclus tenuis]|uniref:Magnesium-transporting ATPase (P-type) n=1 Tax=Rhodocyclus tenuis TaxID=1066 RepID=A0A840G8V5_RHOTE|nr:HAD-IC family P-type ATPase [Rhodocyclus tenuis]MBB4248286.1 magnesium-transporting ATPase (P-type) [Rhodocyclus tenuis]
MLKWHATETATVTNYFAVDPASGLTDVVAAERLRSYGANRPSARPGRGAFLRFVAQLVQPLILVLIAAGMVTLFLREWVDSAVIFGVVLVNALVGFIQEGKAEAALAALVRAVAAEATVVRDGARRRLDAIHLVPGDVVVLAAGDKVPADLRLFSGKELRHAEAALTGESLPVAKHVEPLPAETPLADRHNMAYAGTFVVGGQGTGVVVATGDATETGRISALIASAPDLTTPLTRQLDVFARRLLVAILILAVLTFGVGVLRGESALDMFMAAVALAVGAIPEGLPAAMTVTLAIGVARMARRRAIIRKLSAVETLGSTTVICSDKTGTLTENAMTVREIRAGGEHFTLSGDGYAPVGGIEREGLPATVAGALKETLVASVLCNDARLAQVENQWTVIGDPTEAALLVAARKANLDEAILNSLFPRRDELPFDSARQVMATLHEVDGVCVVYVKGAVEKLLGACAGRLDRQGREVPLAGEDVQAAALRMAEAGLRVLALARSELSPTQVLEHEHLGSGLVFLGLIGMIDPPRSSAAAAVRACHAAGIRVKMITGDHPGTAVAIARQLGIADAGTCALTGQELARLDDDGLRQAAATVNVFARVEPEQKLRLVKALQADGEVVAMTGDGVNDAPALKQADIGVAMGLGGTEVAKEAAEMVLTDDNFATIEAAVEEGRGIYDNLVKFIVWTIPTNAGEGLVILAAILAGSTLPITPLQILWINMTTAILLGMMLAFEPAEQGIMQRPPRAPSAPILDRPLLLRILLVSILLLSGAFGLFELALQRGQSLAEARTIAANVFVLVETLYLFNCRSLSRPFWSIGAFANPWVWAGSGAMLLLQLAFTYVPVMNSIFQTAPIGLSDWATIGAFAVFCAAAVELEKRWRLASACRPPALSAGR